MGKKNKMNSSELTLLDFMARNDVSKKLNLEEVLLYFGCLHHKYYHEIEPHTEIGKINGEYHKRQIGWVLKQMKQYFDLGIKDDKCVETYRDKCKGTQNNG